MTNKILSTFLTKFIPENTSKLDRYKIIYRPYITPFIEVLNLIKEDSNVFDIGCGNGALLNLIYQTKHPKKIGGIEISEKLVNTAKKLLNKTTKDDLTFTESIDIKQYNGTNIPDLKVYDFVLLIDVLHHIPKTQLDSFLILLKSKMRKGAQLILKDIDAGKPILVLFNKLHDLVVSQEIGNEISKQKGIEKLTEAGFSVDFSTYKRMLWYPHYTIVATA